ncbi:hypothetical protein M6B38_351540 [Iris pallida]|uniref:Uncharacterized protein n=1 Tax=Iris pallida TaxID=29817 RepID=A0AAX6GQB2_IRIPA|nr:hypothetical protein M6B38_351540 [Iris pallida]
MLIDFPATTSSSLVTALDDDDKVSHLDKRRLCLTSWSCVFLPDQIFFSSDLSSGCGECGFDCVQCVRV